MIGSNFGPYEILSALGAGGMGEVYRAKDSRLQRDVALKILLTDALIDPERQRRFLQEARSASALNHPNILSVYDIGKENGRQYIVSELVEGESLRSLLQRGPIPLRKMLEIALQVAAGLTAAHEAGIVHRDLKPENIMLTRDDRVKILDFGLAKPGAPRTGSQEEQTRSHLLTMPGMIVGTASYMSPEQARGEEVDFRSDQFSFGLILYEMATGKKAFQRDTPIQTLSAIISDDPAPLSDSNRKIPTPLKWQIERCLAKSPRERYGATIDMYHELKNLRDHLSETSYTTEPLQTIRGGRKWQLIFGALLLSLLSLLGGMGLSRKPAKTNPIDYSTLKFTPLAINDEIENDASWSPDGRSIAYAAEVNGVMQIFTRSLSASLPVQLTNAETDAHRPAWSSDGTRLYYDLQRKDSTFFDLWAVSAAGGSPQLILQNAAGPALSRDGRVLFIFRRKSLENPTFSLWISSPVGSEPKKYTDAPFADASWLDGEVEFSPDGSKVGVRYGTDEKQTGFWVLDYPKGKRKKLDKFSQIEFLEFNWMPDNRHIILSGDPKKNTGKHLWIADTETEETYPLTIGIEQELSPAVSPDGKKVVYTAANLQYDLISIPVDGSPLINLTNTLRSEKAPAYARQGSQFAYVSDRNGTDIIWLKSEQEGWERPLVTEKDFEGITVFSFSRPSFSPDGRRIAYHVNTKENTSIWISNIAGGTPVRLYKEDASQFAPSWSPDGNWLTYLSKTGLKYVIAKAQIGSNSPPTIIKQDAVYFQPQWSPDGKWILYHSERGLNLISPDGKELRNILPVGSASNRETPLSGTWLTGGWAQDGITVYAVRQDENRKLILVAYSIETSQQRKIGDLGRSPILIGDAAFAGFSLAPDGKSFATSVLRAKADLWILEGFKTLK
jgi:serine/threonine protein kinase